MTKIEFKILSYIHRSKKGITGIDVINHFKKINEPIDRQAYLHTLYQNGFITCSPTFDVSRVFLITNKGISAIEEYKEEKQELKCTARRANISLLISALALLISALTFFCKK